MARNFVRTSSQYLTNSNAVVTAAPLSAAWWMKSSDVTNTKVPFVIGDTAAANKFYTYLTTAERLQVGTQEAGAASEAANTATFSADTWTHIAAVWASASSRLGYMGGVAGTENTATRTPSGLDTTVIGTDYNSGTPGTYYDGDMAEVAVWNVALTAADVAMLANGASPLLVRPEGLVSYWPLYGKNSPEIDVVGGFDMTLTNSPVAAVHPRVLMPRGRAYMPGKAAVAAAGWGPLTGAERNRLVLAA